MASYKLYRTLNRFRILTDILLCFLAYARTARRTESAYNFKIKNLVMHCLNWSISKGEHSKKLFSKLYQKTVENENKNQIFSYTKKIFRQGTELLISCLNSFINKYISLNR